MPGDLLPRCDFNTQNLAVRLNVEIAADVNSISPVVDRVMDIVRDMGCAAGREVDVEISLREALANAIVHGAKLDRSKRVQFCVACDPDAGMLVIVRSPGPGFDPASLPSPIVGENIFATHGRGIFLINQLMDEVRYERGGTEIHMRTF
jgi:serine/threonine-protein kinase RsbW